MSVNQIQDNTAAHNIVNNPITTSPNMLPPTTHQAAAHEMPANPSLPKQEELFSPIVADNIPSQMETNYSKLKGSKKLKKNVKVYNRVMDHNIAVPNSNLPQKKSCNYFHTDYNKYLGAAKKLKLQYPDTFNNQQPNSSPSVNNLITVSAMKQSSESVQNDLTPFTSCSGTGLLQQNSVSPTKTLQEKLAERQKANQLNENNLTSKLCKDGNSEDVIVLD
ncbi:hypothetical protein DOY81_006963 [Sarcophaga bullata]|nr:hypothetical protein DOY81_006963 [Sarcophaga bullata]